MTEEIFINQTYPLLHKQDYLILNHFKNQKIVSNNKDINSNLNKQSLEKRKAKSISNKQFPVKRGYGKLSYNYVNDIQLNSKAQVQNNKLIADCLIKSQLIESQYRTQLKKDHEKQQKMLRIHPVDVKKYYEQKHLQDVQDAYYRVGQIIQQSQNRQKNNKQKIQRVKTLSRSKSKQSGIKFRNKQKHNQKLIKQTIKLKQEYCDIKIPRIMGRLYNDVQSKIQSNMIYPICHQISQKTLQKSVSTRIFMSTKQNILNDSKLTKQKNSEKDLLKFKNSSESNFNTNQSSSLKKSNLLFSQLKNINDYESQLHPNCQIKNKIHSQQKEQYTLRKLLNKCKSQKDFKQIQRRKIVTDGFIKNWEQGPYLKNEKLQCKHSQKLKQQKRNRMNIKNQDIDSKFINNKQLFEYQNNPYSRHEMLKKYQDKFLQTSRNIPILSSRS